MKILLLIIERSSTLHQLEDQTQWCSLICSLSTYPLYEPYSFSSTGNMVKVTFSRQGFLQKPENTELEEHCLAATSRSRDHHIVVGEENFSETFTLNSVEVSVRNRSFFQILTVTLLITTGELRKFWQSS